MEQIEFRPFPKIARLRREVVVTEKIDGTNAAIGITDDDTGRVYAQSRKRLIHPGKSSDNHGFAAWVQHHAVLLREVLGPGLHFGEWYGRGIQRGYGIDVGQGDGNGHYFALFNTKRWQGNPDLHRVPGLTNTPWLGGVETFDTDRIEGIADALYAAGSQATGAAAGFDPEGIVIYHTQGNILFKRTFANDDAGKGHGA